jgi:hypothetical protein
MMMIWMMMKTFFYRGIGTKCTANKISNPKRDDDDDDKAKAPDNGADNGQQSTKNYTNNNNNTNNTTTDEGINQRSWRKQEPRPTKAINDHETTKMTTDGTNKQGRMTTMGTTEIPTATGTLDRKTSQASTPTCLYHNNNHQKTQDD